MTMVNPVPLLSHLYYLSEPKLRPDGKGVRPTTQM